MSSQPPSTSPLPLPLSLSQRQKQPQVPKRLSKRSDTKPRRRRESLDIILDDLSSWDLLYMRSRIRQGLIKLDAFAGLSELPPEVFASIVPHLGLQDVFNCYLVCKEWRTAWMQGGVASALCLRFFPGLLELYNGDVPDRHELFVVTAKRYLQKKYVKRSFVSWDVGWSTDVFTNPEEPPASRPLGDLRKVDFGYGPLTVSYANGKLAWQPDNCHVIVDDLYTRERSRFSFGMDFISGRPLQLQAVTDSLVILASSSPQHRNRHIMDNGQTITVFHLHYGGSKNVVLPGKFAHCFAQGDMVAFVTKQGHVVVWGWSDNAIELDIDHSQHSHQPNGWEGYFGGVPGVMFHPTDTDVVFGAWLHSPPHPDPRIHIIIVIKFENGLPVKRFETSISHPEYRRDPTSRYSCPAMRLTLNCQKMDAYGGYALGVVQLVLEREGPPWIDKDPPLNTDWLCICFNVLTESFIQNKYESYRRPHPSQARHFDLCAWEDQLVITWFDEYLVSQDYAHGMQWLQPIPIGDSASRCPHTNEIDDTIRRQQAEVGNYMVDHGFGRRIFMDADFFVITTGQGFMLLSFNSQLDLPGAVSRDANGVPEKFKNPPSPRAGEGIEPPRLSTAWDTRYVTSLVKVSLDTDLQTSMYPKVEQPGW